MPTYIMPEEAQPRRLSDFQMFPFHRQEEPIFHVQVLEKHHMLLMRCLII